MILEIQQQKDNLVSDYLSVIPFKEDDWKTMKMLKGSLSIMKERNLDGRFSKAIDKESTLLQEYIKEYIQ